MASCVWNEAGIQLQHEMAAPKLLLLLEKTYRQLVSKKKKSKLIQPLFACEKFDLLIRGNMRWTEDVELVVLVYRVL